MHIIIVWTADLVKANQYADHGYEPIECSIAGKSVLGPYVMDHHGDQSFREGVAIRAYRDHFGARKSDPRFVVTGAADADACFAIAALCGLLPHPSQRGRELTLLAELVDQMDIASTDVRLTDTSAHGTTLLVWNAMGSQAQDATAFHAGIDRWRALTVRTPEQDFSAAKAIARMTVL